MRFGGKLGRLFFHQNVILDAAILECVTVILEAADAIITICQENLDNPAVDTPVPTDEDETPTPEATLSS